MIDNAFSLNFNKFIMITSRVYVSGAFPSALRTVLQSNNVILFIIHLII